MSQTWSTISHLARLSRRQIARPAYHAGQAAAASRKRASQLSPNPVATLRETLHQPVSPQTSKAVVKASWHKTLHGRQPPAMEPRSQANRRDLGSAPRWVETSDFGRRGGSGIAAGSVRWASVNIGDVAFGPNDDGKEGPEDEDTWLSSCDRNPVHRRHLERLREALAPLDRDAEVLELVDECPSNAEWGVLEAHFRNVRWLLVETGFNEDWFDRKFPLSWPLELLVISSACGEMVTTPAVLEGRIPHLILLLTSNLRFEGPENGALDTCEDLANETEERLNEDNAGEGKPNLAITYRPARATQWLLDKYSGDVPWPGPIPEDRPASRLKTLEILENDAIDTFQRLALGHSYLVMGLERLSLRSMHGGDFHLTPENLFPQLFSQMSNLKHLELSLNYPFDDKTILPGLYQSLPPNLETLSFRGPPSLADSVRFSEWVAAFGSTDFLPSLKKLSFVLNAGTNAGVNNPSSTSAAVEELLAAASGRGVALEEFRDPWDDVSFFRRYDKWSGEAEQPGPESEGADR